MRKGKVEGNLVGLAHVIVEIHTRSHLLAQAVPDVVQILRLKEVLRRPLLEPVLVVGMVVQGKDGLDILPRTLLWSDARTAFGYGVGDELIYDSQPLGFIEGLCFEGFASCFGGGSRSNTVNPVTDPTAAISS